MFAATLTGLGERAHLLGPEVSLGTHAADVANLLKYRDLADTVLVGHSYGGVVITAAAEQVPGRLRGLVYLDASTPADGQSNNDVLGPNMAARLRLSAEQEGEGWRVPPFPVAGWNLPDALRPWVEERLTPHPLRTLEEPVHRRSSAAADLPRAFLRSSVRSAFYAELAARAGAEGWTCRDLSGGHYPMLTVPQVVASALAELWP